MNAVTVAPTSKYTCVLPPWDMSMPSITMVVPMASPHTSAQMLHAIAAITPTEINVSMLAVR